MTLWPFEKDPAGAEQDAAEAAREAALADRDRFEEMGPLPLGTPRGSESTGSRRSCSPERRTP